MISEIPLPPPDERGKRFYSLYFTTGPTTTPRRVKVTRAYAASLSPEACHARAKELAKAQYPDARDFRIADMSGRTIK